MGDLVKKGGIVEYTVHFTSGTSPVPSGSRLTFTSGVTPSNVPSCTSTAGNIIVGSAIPDAILLEVSTLAIPLIWTCMFQVTVNQVQQDAGEIAPFDVQFSYTAGVAWYIPKTTTISVPVWTGAKLTYTRWDTMQTTDLFYPCEHRTLKPCAPLSAVLGVVPASLLAVCTTTCSKLTGCSGPATLMPPANKCLTSAANGACILSCSDCGCAG